MEDQILTDEEMETDETGFKEPASEEKQDVVAAETDDSFDAERLVDDQHLPVDTDHESESDRLEVQIEDLESTIQDDSIIDAGAQNDSLSENTNLAIESLDAVAGDRYEHTSDKDERIMDIVDSTVQAIENGVSESEVLSDVSSNITEFYESQMADVETAVEDTVNRIADAVHEMASVFEMPDSAVEEMLSGISDESMMNAIHEQIEIVDADMTTDAFGSFGSLVYDDSGHVFDQVETMHPEERFEAGGFDVDSAITELEQHMDQAVSSPELQDLLSNDLESTQMDVDEGIDSSIDSGLTGSDGIASDVISEVGEEAADLIAALL